MAPLDQQTYLQDFKQQLIVERLLHLLVEAATDINSHLLVSLNQPSPDSYFDSFIAVGRNQIIPLALAYQLAPATGLRNRLVHEYDAINPVIVFQSIASALDLFPQYLTHIQNYLDQVATS
jgi:uncharacterized protein YutE (UPF0331/DUF86 family)